MLRTTYDFKKAARMIVLVVEACGLNLGPVGRTRVGPSGLDIDCSHLIFMSKNATFFSKNLKGSQLSSVHSIIVGFSFQYSHAYII